MTADQITIGLRIRHTLWFADGVDMTGTIDAIGGDLCSIKFDKPTESGRAGGLIKIPDDISYWEVLKC